MFIEDVLLLMHFCQAGMFAGNTVGFTYGPISPFKTADSHGRILGSGLGIHSKARTCLWNSCGQSTKIGVREACCTCCGLC